MVAWMTWLGSVAVAGPCDLGGQEPDAWVEAGLAASDALVQTRSQLSGADIEAVVALVDDAAPLEPSLSAWSSVYPQERLARISGSLLVIDHRGAATWGPPFAPLPPSRRDAPHVVVALARDAAGIANARMLTSQSSAGARLLRHRALVSWPTLRGVGLLWNDDGDLPVGAASVVSGQSITEALAATLSDDTVLLMASRVAEGVGFCALTRHGQQAGVVPPGPWEVLADPEVTTELAKRGLETVPSTKGGPLPEALPLPDTVATVVRKHRRVLVFGPGSLVRAPWLALPLEPEGEPLVQTHTVEIVSSLGELLIPERPWSRPRRGVVVAVSDPPPTSGLQPIPQAREEAQLVAARFGAARSLLDGEATRLHVEGAVLRGGGVLHVAAHGSSSSDDPVKGSGVWLSGQDALLDVADIMGMDLSAYGLVVLSACDSGTGKDLEAGVISLARGFHIAGVPVVIASRKPVGDASTRALMDRFYEHLLTDSDRPPPHEALRRAMVDRRAEDPRSLAWADFAVFRR